MSKKSNSPENPRLDPKTCCTCHAAISDQSSYIRCVKCKDFIQCFECFSTGRSYFLDGQQRLICGKLMVSHPVSHGYFVVRPFSSPVYREDWDQEEELLLLQGIKMLGVDNWQEIAKVVITKRDFECKEHYYNTYIFPSNCSCPLPEERVLEKVEADEPIYPSPVQGHSNDSKPSDRHVDNLKKNKRTKPATTGEFSGYMPYRHEFETEFMNDAENLVKDLHIVDDEKEEAFYSKMNYLQSYNFIVAQRKEKCKIIEDWEINKIEIKNETKNKQKILPSKYKSVVEAENITELKEINQRLLTLAPYLGLEKTFEFIKAIDQNMKENHQINEYKEWQSYQIESLNEGYMFKKLQEYAEKTEIDGWNREIQEYLKKPINGMYKNKFLSQDENIFCSTNKINPNFYLAVKDFLIREFSIQEFQKENLMQIATDNSSFQQMEMIFDYLQNIGII